MGTRHDPRTSSRGPRSPNKVTSTKTRGDRGCPNTFTSCLSKFFVGRDVRKQSGQNKSPCRHCCRQTRPSKPVGLDPAAHVLKVLRWSVFEILPNMGLRNLCPQSILKLSVDQVIRCLSFWVWSAVLRLSLCSYCGYGQLALDS